MANCLLFVADDTPAHQRGVCAQARPTPVPLALLGLAIVALGGVLVRRRR